MARRPTCPAPFRRALGLVAMLALAACGDDDAASPRSEPIQRAVAAADEVAPGDFAVYEVTRAFLPVLDRWQRPADGLLEWIPASAVPPPPAPGATQVDAVTGVASPGRYRVPATGYSILTLIADAGGVAPGLDTPQVRLIRNGLIHGTSLARLLAEPRLDTRLRAGDRVVIEAGRQAFLSLGAAGSQRRHPFPADTLTALEAISIIGGVEAGRGNARGVLVLREYPASAVRAGAGGPDQARVVFTLDLTTADGLFSARNFRIENGDVVLVTETPQNRSQSTIRMIETAFDLIGQGVALVN